MKEELQKRLLKKYPSLFRVVDGNITNALAFGVECGNGWFKVLDELFEKISKDRTVRLAQVKEKFGGLRVYICPMETDNFKAIYALIDEAEAKAFKTCELCGAKGKPRKASWVKTLCDRCAFLFYNKQT